MEKVKILIVDDDDDIITVLKAILENADYTVIAAASKKEGLEKLAKKPDLAILDVIMETNQAGFELAREIRKMPDFEKLPILMLTSVGDVTGVNFQAAMSDPDWLPADAYIEKPIEPTELLDEIKTLLENRE